MQLTSVNIGQPQVIPNASKSGQSGIFKQATEQAVEVTSLGLVSDAVLDKKHHGGLALRASRLGKR